MPREQREKERNRERDIDGWRADRLSRVCVCSFMPLPRVANTRRRRYWKWAWSLELRGRLVRLDTQSHTEAAPKSTAAFAFSNQPTCAEFVSYPPATLAFLHTYICTVPLYTDVHSAFFQSYWLAHTRNKRRASNATRFLEWKRLQVQKILRRTVTFAFIYSVLFFTSSLPCSMCNKFSLFYNSHIFASLLLAVSSEYIL